MVLAVLVCIVGLAVVLLAIYLGDEAPADARDSVPPIVTSPSQVCDVRFPRSWRGYDPVAVETHLAAVADAYAVLLDEAPADVVERARRRIAGPGPDEERGVDAPVGTPHDPRDGADPHDGTDPGR